MKLSQSEKINLKSVFKVELNNWMQNVLSLYCLKTCKKSCCDCEGAVKIDKGYEHLFQTYKLTGKKVPVKPMNSLGPHLFKFKEDNHWYFTGGACPNYNKENKKCLVHGQHPMCVLYPLIKIKDGYQIFSVCELHKLNFNQEPLKSLFLICKKYGLKLEKEKTNIK